jgi:exopolysaccharide biosynthesis protein
MRQAPSHCHFIFLLVLFVVQACSPALTPEDKQISRAAWVSEKVSPGVQWKYHHFEDLFNARQSVTVLRVDLKSVSARVEHLDSGFFLTSTRAYEADAVAAVNGSFFNTKRGGSVVFFQKEGVVITPSNDAPRAYRDNAGFAIDPSGRIAIIKKPMDGWKQSNQYATILSSGPLLLLDGKIVPQVQEKFNTNRHPRTAIGLTKDRHLIAVVVDGRSAEAYGMTTEELAKVMKGLGCTVAMNLDGGGSSTAWVKGQPFNGVVNFPSDNKKFDHEGERAVANCIVFVPK